MIKSMTPLSMAEAVEYVNRESGTEIKSFVKKFVKLSSEKAKELKTKLERLDLMKVRQEHVAKIIDLMPEREEELNKIFTDVELNEDETKKILDTIKEFK